MNRAQRRKQDKLVKQELRQRGVSENQFKQLMDDSVQLMIRSEVEKQGQRMTEGMCLALERTLSKKEFRISESRKVAILEEFVEQSKIVVKERK